MGSVEPELFFSLARYPMSDLETELLEVCSRHGAVLMLLDGAFHIRVAPRAAAPETPKPFQLDTGAGLSVGALA